MVCQKSDLVILGAGGVGRFIAHTINEINNISKKWNIIGYIDDNNEVRDQIDNLPVIGTSDWLINKTDIAVIIALSDPKTKQHIVSKLLGYGCNNFPSIIHPKSWVAHDVEIGEGCIIYPGSAINVKSKIGRFAMINMNCSIGHDVDIGDYAFLAPNVGIGGNSCISEGCIVGIGASIIQSVNMSEWSVVGAGSVVIKNVDPYQTLVGIPAKPINKPK